MPQSTCLFTADSHLGISCALLLQVKPIRTPISRSLYGHRLSFLFGKYPGVKGIDHMVDIFLIFKTAELFSKLFPFIFLPAVKENSVAPTLYQYSVWQSF